MKTWTKYYSAHKAMRFAHEYYRLGRLNISWINPEFSRAASPYVYCPEKRVGVQIFIRGSKMISVISFLQKMCAAYKECEYRWKT